MPFRVPANYGRLMDRSPMPKSPVARVLTAAALSLLVAAGSSPALSETRAPIFTADRDACYGRVYDQAHLKAHPRQKVTSFHVMRSLEPRREAENWTPDARAEAIRMFREDGLTSVTAFVNFRDRKGTFHNSLTCEQAEKDGVRCMIECDGGSFRLAPASANSVLLHNNGFVLIGGCGEEMPEGQMLHLSPGTDDKMFRLDSKPVAACRAEEQRATPVAAGVPLRERFKEDEQFCFGRDYDAAHLAKNPKQLVSQVRVGRLAPGKERDDEGASKWWWFNVKLDVSITLRSNSADHHRALCLHGEGSELGVLPHRRG